MFVVPEYNYGVNSATKNAIDYFHQESARKPAGFVSCGGVAAGTRAVQMLAQIVSALRMSTLTEAVNVPFVTRFIDELGVFAPNDELTDGAVMLLDELVGVAGAPKRLRQPSGVEVLRRFLDVEREYSTAGGSDADADFDVFLPLLAEDAVMRQAKHPPNGGDWVGHDGFSEFFAQLSRTCAPSSSMSRPRAATASLSRCGRPRSQVLEAGSAGGRARRDPRWAGPQLWPFYYDVAEVNDVMTDKEANDAEHTR